MPQTCHGERWRRFGRIGSRGVGRAKVDTRKVGGACGAPVPTYPATSLIRASISSTAFSTGQCSLTTRFIAFAHTFSLFSTVNL